jgi:osomolarity two-component system sensor histidine kinase NIK1
VREVRTEGRLGEQATIMDAGGSWKDLTVNVNVMTTNVGDPLSELTFHVELS